VPEVPEPEPTESWLQLSKLQIVHSFIINATHFYTDSSMQCNWALTPDFERVLPIMRHDIIDQNLTNKTYNNEDLTEAVVSTKTWDKIFIQSLLERTLFLLIEVATIVYNGMPTQLACLHEFHLYRDVFRNRGQFKTWLKKWTLWYRN
jgi:hypothetical protein